MDSLETRKRKFLEKSKAVHGNKYDYSEIDYINADTKVKIYCKKHDVWFEQIPYHHTAGQTSCKECVMEKTKQTNLKKYGVKFPVQSKEILNKMKQTNLERYGCENVFQNEKIKEKSKTTMVKRYGVKYAHQNKELRKKFNNTMFERYGVENALTSTKFLDKAKQSNLDRFGVEHPAQSKEIYNKMMNTNLERYNVEYPFQSEAIRDKSKITNLEKYGVENPAQNLDVQNKINDTKRKNNTFGSSEPEEIMFKSLIEIFGEENVVRQYGDEKYPFACDFYLKPFNMFIELNASWTHGFHWFDENSKIDLEILSIWKEKSKTSKFYENAIETWTKRDVEKRKYAKKNKLNYLVFWDNDLKDFKEWLSVGCPIGKDYIKEYSWKED